MGTIVASELIARASDTLHDKNNVRWSKPDLLKWLMSGIRVIITVRPSAYVKNEAVKLVAGTKQALPARGTTFFDVVRNMGADGSKPGRVPRFIEKARMDAQNPNWHAAPASATVMEYTYDPRDPKVFYVSPPQPAANQGYVDISYSAEPAAIEEGDAIPVDDIYAEPLIDYLLYRAYAKDPINASKAVMYMQAFSSAIGAKGTVDAALEAAQDKEA